MTDPQFGGSLLGGDRRVTGGLFAAGTRQTSLEVTASDLAAHEGEEIISRAGTGEEQVIPLERQISNRFPTVITPSEQVAAEVAHHDVPITAAINEAIGNPSKALTLVCSRAGCTAA